MLLENSKDVKIINKTFQILKLSKKFKKNIFLCTTSKRIFVNYLLKRFNLKKYFDFIICGEDVKRGKPNFEIYEMVKNTVGNDKKIIVLEDSSYGFEAVKKSQCDCLFFKNNEFKFYDFKK